MLVQISRLINVKSFSKSSFNTFISSECVNQPSKTAMIFLSRYRAARVPREIVFALAKGQYGRVKGCYKLAFTKIMKHLHVEYLERHRKNGQFQALWISRINAAAREYRLTYKNFMVGLRRSQSALDRKALCNLAETEPITFKVLVDEAKRIKFPGHMKTRDLRDF